MRYEKIRLILIAVTITIAIGACDKTRPTKTVSTRRLLDRSHPVSKQCDRQRQKANMTNMIVSDYHFLPHRALLNNTGASRIATLAQIISGYGGNVYLDLNHPDTELAKARKTTVTKYLEKMGLPEDKIHVKMEISPTEGMPAEEAITIYDGTRFCEESESESVGISLK